MRAHFSMTICLLILPFYVFAQSGLDSIKSRDTYYEETFYYQKAGPDASNTQSLFADRNADRFRYSQLWKRHKVYKTAGWITFSAGIGCAFAGFICGAGDLYNSHAGRSWMERNYYNVLFAGGLTITAGSIPLFVMSHKYRKRALDVNIGTTAISHPCQSGIIANAPALCIGLRL